VIRLVDVGFVYPDAETAVFEGVSGELPGGGGVLQLSGANGAGKTTLLKVVLGLLAPSSGRVEGVAGRPLAAVFQEDRLIEPLSAIANVRLTSRRPATNAEICAELTAIGLDADAWDRPVSALSGGQRRRVCLVRALRADAEVIALDEPFTGIDADALPEVMAYVRDRIAGLDVILITHDPAQASFFGGEIIQLG